MQLFEPALLFSLAISAYALRNVTVDDTNGDEATGNQIIYQPADIWQLGQSCTNCTAKLDPNQAYDSTWHDSSYFPPGTSAFDSGQFPNASYTFNGTAIYVFCILFRTSSSPDGNTDMTFFIDGSEVTSYELAPDNDTTILYDQVVFSEGNLLNGSHTIMITTGLAKQKALILLDRLVYTVDDGSTSTATTSLSSLSPIFPTSSSSTSSSDAVIDRSICISDVWIIFIFVTFALSISPHRPLYL